MAIQQNFFNVQDFHNRLINLIINLVNSCFLKKACRNQGMEVFKIFLWAAKHSSLAGARKLLQTGFFHNWSGKLTDIDDPNIKRFLNGTHLSGIDRTTKTTVEHLLPSYPSPTFLLSLVLFRLHSTLSLSLFGSASAARESTFITDPPLNQGFALAHPQATLCSEYISPSQLNLGLIPSS